MTKFGTSNLLFYIKTLVRVIAFLFIKKVFDIEEVFFIYLRNDVDIYYRGIVVVILSLFSIISKTFLMALIFLVILALVSEKLLFPTKYVNKRSVSRLIFF